jgi:hypothetical protein
MKLATRVWIPLLIIVPMIVAIVIGGGAVGFVVIAIVGQAVPAAISIVPALS